MTAFMEDTDLAPTAVLQLRNTQPEPSRAQAIKYRTRLRRAILDCDTCLLRRGLPEGTLPTPPSIPSEPTQPRFTVIGEAPGPEEAKAGKPFVGASGKLLRALMSDAGIDPVTEVVWGNTVCCFPNLDGDIRPPTQDQQQACSSHMFGTIEASWSNYVLLVGAKAFNRFRSDLTITNHHGRVMVWLDQYAVMGIIHPAAALRGKPHYKKVIAADLVKWRDVVMGEDSPLNHLSEECIKCGQTMYRWDRDGVPYCRRHYDQWGSVWKGERTRWLHRSEQLTVF